MVKRLWFVVFAFLSSCACGSFRPDPEKIHFSWPLTGYIFQGFYGGKVSGQDPGVYYDEHDAQKTFNGPGRMHRAVDLDTFRGATVSAAADGVARRYEWDQKDPYGNRVVIDHQNGYWTLYAHLDSIRVPEGKTVQKGEAIGAVGSTGNSTGPHLHFEIRHSSDGHFLVLPHFIPGNAGEFTRGGSTIPHDYPKLR